jgi:hypothetical protein
MTIEAASNGKLDINQVIQRTVEVLRQTWRRLVQPAGLLLFLPSAILGFVAPRGSVFTLESGVRAGGWSLLALLALIPYAAFSGGLLRLALAELTAQPITVGEAMATGRDRLWALLGLYILMGLAVAAGLCLLIVPGVLLALAWSAAPAVLIEERRDILACFSRSADLTRGTRLHIFGAGLIFAVFEILASLVVEFAAAPFPQFVGDVVLRPLCSTVLGVVGVVLMAAIYNDLRGLEADRTAA